MMMNNFYWEDKYNLGNVNGFEITDKPDLGFEYSYVQVSEDIAKFSIGNGSNKELTEVQKAKVIEVFTTIYDAKLEAKLEAKLKAEIADKATEEAKILEQIVAEEKAEASRLKVEKAEALFASEPYVTNRKSLEYLRNTDWYVIREIETQVATPTEITTKRKEAREAVLPEPSSM